MTTTPESVNISPAPQALTVTEFLLARIAEDEAAATSAAQAENEGALSCGEILPAGYAWTDGEGMVVGVGEDNALWDCEGSDTLCVAPEVSAHMSRHDPARVLAECAAKRAVIEAFDPAAPDLDPYVGVSVISMLAAVYEDHPDYRQEWVV